MRLPLLNESESCCFDSYFEMPYEIDDILATFGVSFRMEMMTLPKSQGVSNAAVDLLRSELESSLSIVSMSSDSARA